jgi:hypothetical protein
MEPLLRPKSNLAAASVSVHRPGSPPAVLPNGNGPNETGLSGNGLAQKDSPLCMTLMGIFTGCWQPATQLVRGFRARAVDGHVCPGPLP